MNWYLKALRNYATFEGRARRKEYWLFMLFNFLIATALALAEGVANPFSSSDQGVLATIYYLAVLIPGLAVAVRRMHDTDHSGWWILLPIVNFVLSVREGQSGSNRFGPDPKDGASLERTSTNKQQANVQTLSRPLAGTVASSFCIKCGTRFAEGAAFCSKCGAAR